MPNIYTLDPQKLTSYENAALLLTLLACPAENEERRTEIFHWFCGRAVNLHRCLDPAWETQTQSIKPIYVICAAAQSGEDFGPIGKSFRDRMVAAKMAIPFLRDMEMANPPPLPSAIKRLSINEMAAYCLEDAEQADVNNVKSRIWKPSRPVIHLACATVFVSDEVKLATGTDMTFDHILLEWPIAERIVTLAMQCEDLVARNRGLGIRRDELIHIRIAGLPEGEALPEAAKIRMAE